MKYLNLTFDAPEENLACDEALIAWCEGEQAGGILRVWEPRQYFVVAGYSNKIGAEVNHAASATDGIRVLRRCTGGGAVLQGPGCLNYALVFNHEDEEWLGDLSRSYRIVLERHRELFTALSGAQVTVEGTSDLAVDGRKFSGNSQYRKRRWTLVHGTFLLHFDLARIGAISADAVKRARLPAKSAARRFSRQPQHRQGYCQTGVAKDLGRAGGARRAAAGCYRRIGQGALFAAGMEFEVLGWDWQRH